jgi:pilus assembly protein CpaB
MDAKRLALLIGALIVAAATAFMAKSMFASQPAPSVQAAVMTPTGPEILVATRTLPIGTIIEPDSFRYQPWPNELVDNAYYKKGEADPAGLAGTVVRAPVTAGQPLTKGSLVQPGDRGFLAAALGPGMRAVTVSVSAREGVAGFVFPGDRVDLMLTQTVEGEGGPSLKTAETIVRNVRVLATDQRTVSEDAEGKREVKTFSNITMEVTPRIAEKIAVAQTVGQLSLSLRSIADNTAELERAIASGEVKVPTGNDPKAEKRMLVQVASRPIDTDTSFVVGADVSRFQRRSVPPRSSSQPSNLLLGEAPARPSAPSSGPAPSGSPSPAAPAGPMVRIARGNNVTEVQLGDK